MNESNFTSQNQIWEGWMREYDNKFIQIEKQINSWELRFWNTEGSDIREMYSSNEHLKNLLVDRADLKILEARVDEKLENLVQNISDLTKKVGLNNKNLKFNLKTLENCFYKKKPKTCLLKYSENI